MKRRILPFIVIIIATFIFTSFSSDDEHPVRIGYEWNDEIGDYVDIDECSLDPCLPGHTCINTPGGYRCECVNTDCPCSVCPNGGYQTIGERTESRRLYWATFIINTNVSVGISEDKPSADASAGFDVRQVETTSYNCKGMDSKICWVCNRYIVK